MAPMRALIAVMARRTAAMRNGEVGDTVSHHPPAELFFDHLFGKHTSAREMHGRQELAIRHLLQPLIRGTHTHVTFDVVIIGRQVFVADGPILLISIAAGGFELIVGIAIALPAPTVGLTTDLAAANPHERLIRWKGIGVFAVVNEELVRVLVAGIAKPLDRLLDGQRSAVPKTPKLELVLPDMLSEIARRDTRRPRLEQ